MTFLAGLGDPSKVVGIDLGLQIISLATRRIGSSNSGTLFGSGQGLDLAISRNITNDLGIKIGAFNVVEFDEVQLGEGRSAYGVITTNYTL